MCVLACLSVSNQAGQLLLSILLTCSANGVCVCVLLTGCADCKCTATFLIRQQYGLVHMATPGRRPQQRSSYTLPNCQRSHHSNHQPLSSPALHWNSGPSETHTAKTRGSCLLEQRERDRGRWGGERKRENGRRWMEKVWVWVEIWQVQHVVESTFLLLFSGIQPVMGLLEFGSRDNRSIFTMATAGSA